MARPTRLALLLLCATIPLAAGLSACGGDDSNQPKGPTQAEDEAAIEQLMVTYGGSAGAKTCTYFAENIIEGVGGRDACEQENADASAVVYKVKSVAVNGNSATAVITTGGKVLNYELTREGKPSEFAGGWKISSYPDDGLPSVTEETAAAATETEETTTSTTTTASKEDEARADITELLNALGAAQGDEVCTFYSDSLIKERGGLAACEKYFADKPSLDSTVLQLDVTVPEYKEDVVPAGSAVIRSGQTGAKLYFGVNQTGDFGTYGGWEITSQDDNP